jgi:hypothetical protein
VKGHAGGVLLDDAHRDRSPAPSLIMVLPGGEPLMQLRRRSIVLNG